MDKETLKKLADLFKKEDEDLDLKIFMQILYVLEDVKPGVFLQIEKQIIKNSDWGKDFVSLIQELGLLISFENGGYITKDEKLKEEWEKKGIKQRSIGDYHKFLGYPKCCIKVFFYNIPQSDLIYYYYLLNKDKKELIKLAEINTFLEGYQPCSIHCKKTKERYEKFKKVIKKYQNLIPIKEIRKAEFNNLKNQFYNKEVGSGILKILEMKIEDKNPFQALNNSPEEFYEKIKDKGIDKLWKIDKKEFIRIINDLFYNKEVAKQKIKDFLS